MLTLGDVLGAAKRSTLGFQRWIAAADPDLAAELEVAAERAETSLAGFARAAVADFSRYADEEAWAQLTSMLRDNEDPGIACLAAMVRWRLARDRSSGLYDVS
ncbi:MAG TPA: hypothetical protein VFY81_00645 [Gammaproteobacteria bacterium]|nr:hypothetical protein [Gammaproteobacteria bacterium]